MTRFDRVEALASDHDVSSFDCGSIAQTTWLRRYGLQAHRSDTAKVYVVCLAGTSTVVGYYSLASGSVVHEAAPDRISRGTGRHPIPVVILTRLGVDASQQGVGLGSALVRDALLQVLSVADRVGVRALLIHAETPSAAAFYRHIEPGFETSPTDPLHLVLLLKDLRAAFRDAVDERFPGTWLDEVVEMKRPEVDVGAVLTAVQEAKDDLESGRE